MHLESRTTRLTPLARHDLEQIWHRSSRTWSIEQADAYTRTIFAALESLARGDKAGRPAGVGDGYLKYAVGSHFLFFRLSDHFLDVVRILHKRMDIERHL